MAITRQKKEQILQEYVDLLNSSQAVIFTSYSGLKVSELQQLRTKIREAEGSFSVVKNTLARRALEEVGLPVVDEMLTGPVGISFCHQNVAGVAKAIADFSKGKEFFAVKGGLMGHKVIDEAAVKSLASLPPIEVLRAQLLGLINTPASQLVGVVAGGVRQLVNVFNAYAEKDSEAPAEA
ncbi:MAG: 50S ribosomal protein L10 [Chloroflexota bacterium]